MPLKFNGAWRFNPPADGAFINQAIPDEMIAECIELIGRVSTQEDTQSALEHFKAHFCRACGATHVWSSDEGWAKTDLWRHAREAAKNAPLFIEAFYDACKSYGQNDSDLFAPDARIINDLLAKYRIGYVIDPPRLIPREDLAPLVEVRERPATLAEQALEILQTSLTRSEELLLQGRGREAIQESLWLLETVATAFRGVGTSTGTIEGKYFNTIVKELRASNRGTNLDRILDWITNLHGFLSSPTGGGIRHGLDLSSGVTIGNHEARLFCNLIRSYLSYLLNEHERLVNRQ